MPTGVCVCVTMCVSVWLIKIRWDDFCNDLLWETQHKTLNQTLK